MSKPVTVLIADVHYSLQTLDVADAAMRQAIAKANELDVPLIVAGDLHDTKAHLRGECVRAMIKTFELCNNRPRVLIGNHDLINERSYENSLSFLDKYAELIETPVGIGSLWLIPYHRDPDDLREVLRQIPKGSTIIMHQGLEGSNSGDYIQDKSAITYEDVQDFRVISGHYHQRQDIKTGRPRQGALGMFSYVGNPYTLNFGEANDPEKGYQILMDDGTLEFVPTNLRSHRVIDFSLDEKDYPSSVPYFGPNDLLYVKLRGSSILLAEYSKEAVARTFHIEIPFRLDLIPTDVVDRTVELKLNRSQAEIFDSLIDSLTNTDDNTKTRLKSIWKQFK